MRYFILPLVLIFLPLQALAFEIESRLTLGNEESTRLIRIISTTDADLFKPVLEDYLSGHPDTVIDYVVTSSTDLMSAISDERANFDVAISSAMDLQTKLANDRRTISLSTPATDALPNWARWRHEVFAFTQEPAAIVVSRKAFEGMTIPSTREELINILRSNPEKFTGKVGTYDLRHSGLGYLFATQDSRVSEVYWRLTEVMGALDAKLYRGSSSMIDAVANDELAVAYNVLGSYALSRDDLEKFEVIFPSDFTTVMMRTAVIPDTANNEIGAKQFVDFLLQSAWQRSAEPSAIDPLMVDLNETQTAVRRIRLGPGLLIFLDAFKKKRFLAAWENSILQD